MKKILVPTDFSENANQALKYAIEVANKFGSTVYVLHAYQISSSTGRLISIDHIVEEDREQELSHLLRKVKPLLTGDASIEGYVRRGGSVETVVSAANKLSVDIIIMGTTGASGMKKMFLGSTASNVIKNTELPVLAVPNDFTDFEINNITVALDDKKVPETYVLHPIIQLIRGYEAELNLLHVVEDTDSEESIDPSIQEHLKKFGVPYTYFKLNSKDAGQGILEFVDRKNSNILCLIKHHRSWFQDIFHASMSERLAFESNIPLLVLHS